MWLHNDYHKNVTWSTVQIKHSHLFYRVATIPQRSLGNGLDCSSNSAVCTKSLGTHNYLNNLTKNHFVTLKLSVHDKWYVPLNRKKFHSKWPLHPRMTCWPHEQKAVHVCCMVALSISSHTFSSVAFSWFMLAWLFWHALLWRINPMDYAMGSMSGDDGGQMFLSQKPENCFWHEACVFLAVWDRALSCWNVYFPSGYTACSQGRTCDFNMLM